MNGKITASLLSSSLLFWSPSASSETLNDTLLKVLKSFNYVSDDEQYGTDRRVSFVKEVKRGETFKGDCDDFAYTIRDLLREKGHKVETVVVRIAKISGRMLHMVVKVDDKYMMDNRYPFVRTWKNGMKGSQYELIK